MALFQCAVQVSSLVPPSSRGHHQPNNVQPNDSRTLRKNIGYYTDSTTSCRKSVTSSSLKPPRPLVLAWWAKRVKVRKWIKPLNLSFVVTKPVHLWCRHENPRAAHGDLFSPRNCANEHLRLQSISHERFSLKRSYMPHTVTFNFVF